jgi:biotin-dependent carboxylase-like uncharacterized protein
VSALRVLAPGPATFVEDLGRPGREHGGVAPSGAFDRRAHARAQRLVGNAASAAGLEVLLGPFACVAEGDVVVAVTGAACPVEVGGRPEAGEVALAVPSGVPVRLATARAGLRAYLAVRGGLAVPPVLGSRSWDVGGDLGPPPVAAGALLPVGADVAGVPHYEPVVPRATLPGADSAPHVALVPGPHDELLDAGGWGWLASAPWRVQPDSDRMGVRLAPTAPASARWAGGIPASLPSFPVVPGSVQLTPSGELVVLGPDAGVTGGYPVVGVVADPGLDVLAQCPPGLLVRLAAARGRTRRSPGHGRGSA